MLWLSSNNSFKACRSFILYLNFFCNLNQKILTMNELKNFVAEHNNKKSKPSLLSGSSSNASNSDSEGSSLLSWMQSSVSISMPSMLGGEDAKKDASMTDSIQDRWCPSLSRTQRLLGCAGCVLAGVFCFSLSTMYIPVLILKARKFALLFSLGSLFMINSFSFLFGPYNHLKTLITKERLPFTISYFGSLFLTLYFAMFLKNTILTTLAAVLQVLALSWYLISYVPGGKTGLNFISKLFTKVVTKTCTKSMPI